MIYLLMVKFEQRTLISHWFLVRLFILIISLKTSATQVNMQWKEFFADFYSYWCDPSIHDDILIKKTFIFIALCGDIAYMRNTPKSTHATKFIFRVFLGQFLSILIRIDMIYRSMLKFEGKNNFDFCQFPLPSSDISDAKCNKLE